MDVNWDKYEMDTYTAVCESEENCNDEDNLSVDNTPLLAK